MQDQNYEFEEIRQQYIKIFNSKSNNMFKLREIRFDGNKLCILVEGESNKRTNLMRAINGTFAKYLNKKYLKKGKVFKQHYKVISIKSNEQYQVYSKYFSESSQNIQISSSIYDEIIVYAIKRNISLAQIMNPQNRDEKVEREKLIEELLINKEYSNATIIKVLKISKSTMYRIIKSINQ